MKKIIFGLIFISMISSCGLNTEKNDDTKVLKEISAGVGIPLEVGGGEGNAKGQELGR